MSRLFPKTSTWVSIPSKGVGGGDGASAAPAQEAEPTPTATGCGVPDVGAPTTNSPSSQADGDAANESGKLWYFSVGVVSCML